ncbi:hypothetical protein Gogos_021327, partial [Gossypium gossypioides]|nr:hypothetical protein [Gossypium gossypioides]
MALLRCLKIRVDKVYSKAVNVPIFLKRLMNITRMSEQSITARIKQKGDSKCIHWKNLKDFILAHPDARKKVDVFVLSIYGLVVFPKTLGHVDEAITDLFDQLDKRVTPVSVILVETFRSLNACRRARDGRFIGCAQLLLVWFHSHFWKNLQEEDIEWRAPWLLPDEILYRCGDFDWGLAKCEFSYRGDGYKKRVREIVSTCNQTRRIKGLAVGSMTTSEYSEWWVKRVNDNIPRPSKENSQSIEEHLRVVPSELEIIKQ